LQKRKVPSSSIVYTAEANTHSDDTLEAATNALQVSDDDFHRLSYRHGVTVDTPAPPPHDLRYRNPAVLRPVSTPLSQHYRDYRGIRAIPNPITVQLSLSFSSLPPSLWSDTRRDCCRRCTYSLLWLLSSILLLFRSRYTAAKYCDDRVCLCVCVCLSVYVCSLAKHERWPAAYTDVTTHNCDVSSDEVADTATVKLLHAVTLSHK